MRYLFLLLLFASVLNAQDRTEQLPAILATADGFVLSGSDYVGALKISSPVRRYAYNVDSSLVNDRFIDAAGQVYAVTAISSRTLDRINLTLSPQDTVSFTPKGKGWIWRPDSLGLIPVPADANGWVSQALKGKIEQHNLKLLRDRDDLASEITPGADGTFLTSYGAVTSWENIGVQLYASPRTYLINDLVVRDGIIYRAKTLGATNPTVGNTTDWEVATDVYWDDIINKPTDLATDADVAAAQAAAEAYADANDEGSNWTISGSDIYRNSEVGIGLSSPDTRLNLLGTTSTSANFIRINTSVNNLALSAGIDLMESAGAFGASGQYGARLYYNGADNLFKIQTAIGTTVSDGLSIKRDGGFVGFGTDDPTQKVDINGGLRVRSILSGTPTGVVGYEADGDIVDFPFFSTPGTGTTGSDSWDDFTTGGFHTKFFRPTALNGPPIAAHYLGVNMTTTSGLISQWAYPLVDGQGSEVFFRLYNSGWNGWQEGNPDDQSLSLSGNTLSLTDGGSQDLSEVGPWEPSNDGIIYDGDYTMHQSGSEQIKRHGSRTHVGYDLYSVEPSGTGYLIISFPEEMDSDSYYFSIEIGGYGYGNTSRGFQATVEGYKYAINDLIYNSSTRLLGSMVGGIRTCVYNGKPSFILGDGNTVWSSYEIIEIKRLHTRTASSTQPEFYDGWTSAVVADETGVTLSATGTVQDQTPFSTLGVAGSDQKTTTYLNVRNDEITSSNTGYKVLQIAGYFGDVYNGEIVLSDYTTGTLDKVAKITFNCYNGSGFAAEYAMIEGNFGSNQVKFGRNSDDTFFVILGNGTDAFSTFGTMALTRLTVDGNKSGRYGTSAIEFVHMDDLSSIESVVDVDELVLKDNIYNTDGTIPAGRVAQSYVRPGGTQGRTNLYFARPGASGTFHTGFESEGNNGTGLKLDHRVNGSGTTIEASLSLKTGAHIATMTGDTWYYNNGGQYFGIKWSGLFPQWRVGATQFLDFPNALPAYDNMQWTQDKDGSGKFVIAPYRVSKDRSDQLTNQSFATDGDLTLTLPGGSYHVRAVLVFEGENTNSELTYRLSASGSWTEDGYVSLHTNATETKAFGDTFGENVRTINSARQYQVILEGTIFIQGASGSIAVQRGVLSSSNYVDLLEASLLTATYKPNNL